MAKSLVALACLAMLHHSGRADAQDSFRPTPIPLASWRSEARATEGRASETRPHYWEDALRHSVYLALVRDHIDGLIARDSRLDPAPDRDLWYEIRSAPFERTQRDDRPIFGDIAVLATGRLVEGAQGLRFLEDARGRCAGCPDFFGFNPECGAPACRNRDAVKADWAVKRVRHREPKGSPSPYRYELTFSVMTARGAPHPARTFTLRETPVPEDARIKQSHWVHGNLDDHRSTESERRIFFTLDEDLERPRTPYWGATGVFPFPSKPKVIPPDSRYFKKTTTNPWNQTPKNQYQRPSISPPQKHYLDADSIGVVGVSYDNPRPKHSATISTKDPAAPSKLPDATSTAIINHMTHSVANSQPTSYSSGPIRYGIIVDSRPPAYAFANSGSAIRQKVKSAYYNKQGRPVDFRPSPQVIEMQYSEQMTDPWIIRSPESNLTVVSGENLVAITRFSQPRTTTGRPQKAPEVVSESQTHKYLATTSATTTTTEAPNSTMEELESDMSWTNMFNPITRSPTYDTLKKTTKKVRTSPTTTTTEKTTTTTEEILEITAHTTTTTEKPKSTTAQAAKTPKILKLFKNISRPTTTTTTRSTEPKIRLPSTTTPTSVKNISKLPDESNVTASFNKKNRYRQSTIMLKGIVLKGFKKPPPVKLNKPSSKTPFKWLSRRTTSKFQGYYSKASTTTSTAKYESNIENTPKDESKNTITENILKDSISEATSQNERVVKENLIEEKSNNSETTTIPVPISPIEYSIQKNKTLSMLESKPRMKPVIYSIKENTNKLSNETHNTTIAKDSITIKNNTKCKNKRKYGQKRTTTELPPGITPEPITKKTLVTSVSVRIGNNTEDFTETTIVPTVDMVSLLLGDDIKISQNAEPEMNTTISTELEHATEEFKIPDLSSLFDWV